MNQYDVLDKETIEEIKEHQYNLDELLTIINQLAKDKYDLGYDDGYECGELVGWSDGYDTCEDNNDLYGWCHGEE